MKIEKEAVRISTGATNKCDIALLQIESGWTSILDRKNIKCLSLLYKILNGTGPVYLQQIADKFLLVNQSYN